MSPRRSRSGGIAQRKHVEPVVEVGAEPAGRDLAVRDRGSSRSRSARSRGSACRRRRAAPRPPASTRRSLACAPSGSSPISSRNSVPPSASSNLPARFATAPVNAPRTWPNSSLSITPSGSAAQLTWMNGASRRRIQRGSRAPRAPCRRRSRRASAPGSSVVATASISCRTRSIAGLTPSICVPSEVPRAARQLLDDEPALLGESLDGLDQARRCGAPRLRAHPARRGTPRRARRTRRSRARRRSSTPMT